MSVDLIKRIADSVNRSMKCKWFAYTPELIDEIVKEDNIEKPEPHEYTVAIDNEGVCYASLDITVSEEFEELLRALMLGAQCVLADGHAFAQTAYLRKRCPDISEWLDMIESSKDFLVENYDHMVAEPKTGH